MSLPERRNRYLIYIYGLPLNINIAVMLALETNFFRENPKLVLGVFSCFRRPQNDTRKFGQTVCYFDKLGSTQFPAYFGSLLQPNSDCPCFVCDDYTKTALQK